MTKPPRLHVLVVTAFSKPFRPDELSALASAVLENTADNIRRVKTSAERVRANVEALAAIVAHSRRLLAAVKAEEEARKAREAQLPGWPTMAMPRPDPFLDRPASR